MASYQYKSDPKKSIQVEGITLNDTSVLMGYLFGEHADGISWYKRVKFSTFKSIKNVSQFAGTLQEIDPILQNVSQISKDDKLADIIQDYAWLAVASYISSEVGEHTSANTFKTAAEALYHKLSPVSPHLEGVRIPIQFDQ